MAKNTQVSIINANNKTYSDGTVIPRVQNTSDFANITTGAWCYYGNDATKGKLYNWYAIAGVHDSASLSNPSLRKSFTSDGWRVPDNSDISDMITYLIAEGYNWDGSTSTNMIGKSLASTNLWSVSSSSYDDIVGRNPNLNNSTGFDGKPLGFFQVLTQSFVSRTDVGAWWTIENTYETNAGVGTELRAWSYNLFSSRSYLGQYSAELNSGYSVRLIKDIEDSNLTSREFSFSGTPNYLEIWDTEDIGDDGGDGNDGGGGNNGGGDNGGDDVSDNLTNPKALFIKRADLVKSTAISGNVDTDKFIQFIELAQEIHLQNYLGTDLYNKISNDIISGTLTGDYLDLVNNYIQPMLIHFSMAEYLPFASYTIANGGVYRHQSDNSTLVSKEEVDFLVQKERDYANYYTNRFIDFMGSNASNLFPEYYTNSNEDINPDKDTIFHGWNL